MYIHTYICICSVAVIVDINVYIYTYMYIHTYICICSVAVPPTIMMLQYWKRDDDSLPKKTRSLQKLNI